MDNGDRQYRQEKQEKWNEPEWGKVDRSFDKCPGCGCPARYSVEAMRGEISEDQIRVKPPALGVFQFIYDTALSRTRLDVVFDSCCRCGLIYTVARSKMKKPLVMIPKGRG